MTKPSSTPEEKKDKKVLNITEDYIEIILKESLTRNQLNVIQNASDNLCIALCDFATLNIDTDKFQELKNIVNLTSSQLSEWLVSKNFTNVFSITRGQWNFQTILRTYCQYRHDLAIKNNTKFTINKALFYTAFKEPSSGKIVFNFNKETNTLTIKINDKNFMQYLFKEKPFDNLVNNYVISCTTDKLGKVKRTQPPSLIIEKTTSDNIAFNNKPNQVVEESNDLTQISLDFNKPSFNVLTNNNIIIKKEDLDIIENILSRYQNLKLISFSK
jgi:hypothetical protein